MSQAFWDDRYWAANYWSDYYWEYELPAATGTIAVTLAGDTATWTGNFGEDFQSGTIAPVLADFTADIDGTFLDTNLELGFWHPSFWPRSQFDDRFWANVPGSLASGDVAGIVLEDVTAILPGSFITSGAAVGTIETTLDHVTAVVSATQATVVTIDIPVSVLVDWTVRDLTLEAGGIVGDLADFTALVLGTFQVAGQVNGILPAVLGNAITAFTGTHVTPASRTGLITTQLANVTAAIPGNLFAPSDFQGEIGPTLDDFPTSFVGAHVAPLYSGVIAATLEDTTFLISGQVIAAGAFLGQLHTVLDDTSALLEATYTVDVKSGAIVATFEDVTTLLAGQFIVEGAKIGDVIAFLGDVETLMVGSVFVPAHIAPDSVPVTVRSIDSKTLADQFNIGLAEAPDYEFSNGRRFFQRKTGT